MSEPVKRPASCSSSIEARYGQPVELVTWLKTEHGLGHGHADALAAHALAQRGGAQRPPAEPGAPPAVTGS